MAQDFKSEYAKLNAEQKQAIDYIEGPLLVIAGPGTGKTQLLSLRAANILKKTDVLAENILCLTFTESGAQEMRRRLINIIGEDAYRATISTYHGFGNEIVQRNPSYFEGGLNLRPISKLKKDTIIRQLQKDLPFVSDLKDPMMVNSLSELISSAKQALLFPKDLASTATSNLDFIATASDVTKPLTDNLRVSLKSVEFFSKLVIKNSIQVLPSSIESLSSLWNTELEEAIEETLSSRKAKSLTSWKAKYLTKDVSDLLVAKGAASNERLKEFSKLYGEYIKRLKADNLYDYDDMIQLAIEALKKHDDLRFNLQEKYLYIMLDEYQDTNLAQAELTYLLTNNESSEGKPNIMALGDDDQAIFAFQGAKHSNMLDFVNRYRGVKQITLKSNYRSTQAIIDLSSQVSGQINERLSSMLEGVSKNFQAARKITGQIDNLNFASEIEGYAWLAEDISKTQAKEIAIIAPQHKYLERASAYLIDKDLTISYERRENLLDDPLIDQLVTILRLLKAINDHDQQLIDSLAAQVFNYEFWGLPTDTLAQISWQAYDHFKPWLEVMLETRATRLPALMLIKLAANSLSYRYDFIIDQVIGLSDIVINDPKPKSSRSKFMEYYSKTKDDLTSYRLFQNLIVIREQFKDFNLDNNKPLMVGDLIDFIDQLKSSNIKLTNDFSYGSSDARVKLMSAHGSKGLEFDSVYLLSLTNEAWGPKHLSRSRLSLPPNLEFIRQGADNADDEGLRLLYVALTRARSRLVTLSYDQDSSAKTTTPLKYLPLSPKTLKVKAKLLPLWQADEGQIEINTKLRDLLNKRLETYTLSPTDLNKFIDVRHAGPQSFYKSVLLRYKTPVAPKVDYGSAVHDTLQWLQQTLTAVNKLPSLKQLVDQFEKQLLKRRLPAIDFEHLKKQGTQALSGYYEANKASFSKDDLSEFDFRNEGIVLNNARLSGKIDKLVIDKNAKALSIVDYKTGRGHSQWDSQPRLHIYRNQLYFYKLLVEKSSSFKDYTVKEGMLDFVEPDKTTKGFHQLHLDYDDQEMIHLIKLIEAVWRHLELFNFPSVAGYKPSLAGIKQFEEDLIAGRI